MKKLIALLLALMLLALPALAETAEEPYTPTNPNTLQFLAALDANEMYYSDVWLYGTDECLYLDFDFENIGAVYSVYVHFVEDKPLVRMYVYNLIDFDEANLAEVYRACSDANWESWATRFYVDESDFSVTAEVDVDLFGEENGVMSFEGLYNIVTSCNNAYETFAPYAK